MFGGSFHHTISIQSLGCKTSDVTPYSNTNEVPAFDALVGENQNWDDVDLTQNRRKAIPPHLHHLDRAPSSPHLQDEREQNGVSRSPIKRSNSVHS